MEYFAVCESVAVDQETNRVSLFHIVEDIHLSQGAQTGTPLVQMVAISSWNRTDDDAGKDYQAILKICPPGNVDTQEFRMNFVMERAHHRLLMRIQGVPPLVPGRLDFELWLSGESKPCARHAITVHGPE
jgi:hypothetical protein